MNQESNNDEFKAVTMSRHPAGGYLTCDYRRWEGAEDDTSYLLVTSDEPDLILAAGDARVLIDGDHVGVGAELICHAHNLPQQADLVTDRLLCCRPKERPNIQSESSTS